MRSGTSEDYLLTATHDWCMLERMNRFPVVQSGFLLFNPRLSAPHFEKIRAVYRQGLFDGSGWNDSEIGVNWGGTTTAGILTYYVLAHLPKLEGTWRDVRWNEVISWSPRDPSDQFFKSTEAMCDNKISVGEGKAYLLDFHGLEAKQFRHVLYLDDMEYNVIGSTAVCVPRGKGLAQSLMNIRTVHLTGLSAPIKPNTEEEDWIFLGERGNKQDKHREKCPQNPNFRRTEYIDEFDSKENPDRKKAVDACTHFLDYLAMVQTRLLLRGAARTGLALSTRFC